MTRNTTLRALLATLIFVPEGLQAGDPLAGIIRQEVENVSSRE